MLLRSRQEGRAGAEEGCEDDDDTGELVGELGGGQQVVGMGACERKRRGKNAAAMAMSVNVVGDLEYGDSTGALGTSPWLGLRCRRRAF